MSSKIKINTVADLLGALQCVANEGFNIQKCWQDRFHPLGWNVNCQTN